MVFTHNELKISRIEKPKLINRLCPQAFDQDHDFILVNAHLNADLHNARKLKQLVLYFVLEVLPTTESTIILGDFNYPVGR